ncbi:hypothetical protein CBR_g40478 [Chara braunii]|uniref:Reverse transcriptase domain-containing protein n=1 Tax=Chara braunii TaxID=69332 RepID=A0A388LU14_CHABU|nr:hypothetical protein CBR_g40478 [Chara braunii]|eukprot:GBG85749.1 hypothetical protein CBR_g40478 [Chara braunii]
MCFDDGVYPAEIDPGEMVVEGREVRFKLNTSLDEIKVKWLKERTVTVIFKEAARFLARNIKDDLVRAFEDGWIMGNSTLQHNNRRGRLKIEGPGVASYVAKTREVADFIKTEGQVEITLGSETYKVLFKPWMTRAEFREERRQEEERSFWVMALQVPLDDMPFIYAQIEKAIGRIVLAHPTDAYPARPALVNAWFDLELDARIPPSVGSADNFFTKSKIADVEEEHNIEDPVQLNQARFQRSNRDQWHHRVLPIQVEVIKAQKDKFATQAEWWGVGSRILSNLLNVFSRILAQNRNKEERRLRKKVQQAEQKMKQHPISELTWGKERVRRLAEWDQKQQEESELWTERTKVKGMAVYVRMTRETFQRLAPARSGPTMKELKHPFDTSEPVASRPQDICNYAVACYKDIMTSRRLGEGANTDLLQGSAHWDNTTVRLSRQGRLDLDRPVTKEEVGEAFRVMAGGKTPGNDGLPVEFYRDHWEVMREDLTEIYNEIQLGGNLPVSALEVLEVVSRDEMDMSVLLLDMEKAYDLVNWSYVLTSLRRMGFGEVFCTWVVALYSHSAASVMVNGHIFQPFQLTQSLRQGFPLTPLLFVVHLEILLNNVRNNTQIVGLEVGCRPCKVKAPADDLFAVSVNSQSSMSALRLCLRQYETLSEAAINWSKSVYLLPEKYAPAVDWGMKRVKPQESERFLGVQIALTSCVLRQEEILQSKVSQKLSNWGTAAHISLFGRALVVNVALLALLTYVGNVRPISKKTQAVVKRKATKFVWRPRAEEGEAAMSKVTWDLICAPRHAGGLGMVDPGRRNQALLARWVLRAIMEEKEKHWILLAEVILSREWQLSRAEDVWACVWIESYLRRRIKSEFWGAVLQAWRAVKPDMLSEPQTKQEVLEQILFENPRIRGPDGMTLKANGDSGSFGRAWMERGVVRIRNMWDKFSGCWLNEEVLRGKLFPCKFTKLRKTQILEAIPEEWLLVFSPSYPDPTGTWYEQLAAEEAEAGAPRRFLKIVEQSEDKFTIVPIGRLEQVRVRERVEDDGEWRVWIWKAGKPIKQLKADPNQWVWRSRGPHGEHVRLDEFTLNLAQEVLAPLRTPLMTASERWSRILSVDSPRISHALSSCWKQISDAPNPRAAALLWLESLLATPSAVSLNSREILVELQCKRCSWSFESTPHIWWDCPASRRIWDWWAKQWGVWTDHVMKWDRDWVLLGGLPDNIHGERGWGYVA